MSILKDNPYFRPALWPTLFLLLSLPILAWLGTWQLQRLEWKLGLIERLEERLSADPVPLPDELSAADEYRRYTIEGVVKPGTEFHWLTTSDAYGIGYLVFAPFQLSDGRWVIVNRGFIPQALKEEAGTRSAASITPVQLTVRARVPEVPGSLDAVNDVAANIWFTRDTNHMAALSGETGFLPLYLEVEGEVAEGVWPKPGATDVTIVNNHLDYALTWYGLGLALVVIYLVFHASQGRMGRKTPAKSPKA